MEDKKNGKWVTIKGNHIFLKDGQTVDDYFKSRNNQQNIHKSHELTPKQKGTVDYNLSEPVFEGKSSKETLNFVERSNEEKRKLVDSICVEHKGHLVTYNSPEIKKIQGLIDEYAKEPTVDIDTPERQAMRTKMVDDYVRIYGANAKKEKKLYVVMGLAASGKSSAIANVLVKQYGGALVDADIFKEGDKNTGFEGLPEYTINGVTGAGVSKVHRESSNLAKVVQRKMIEQGMNIVYPTVGGEYDDVMNKLKPFMDAGYEINISQAYVPLERGLQNALQRYVSTGRLTVPKILTNNDGKPLEVYDKLKTHPKINSMGLFRTDHNWKAGQKPRLIHKKGNVFDCIYK